MASRTPPKPLIPLNSKYSQLSAKYPLNFSCTEFIVQGTEPQMDCANITGRVKPNRKLRLVCNVLGTSPGSSSRDGHEIDVESERLSHEAFS